MPDRPTLSILIPLYNGSEFLAECLEALIHQCNPTTTEIVVCDDCSTDNSYSIAAEYARKSAAIRLHGNDVNVGMDKNFIRTASLANGYYLWFCGQDDVIGEGAVEKVRSVLKRMPDLDFIYMNYGQFDHYLKHPITQRILDIHHDIVCEDWRHFLSVTTLENLPGFLPSFVLRKSLWDSIDPTPYIKSIFVHLGIFLALLRRLRIYVIAHPYVYGRIPDNGWQQDPLKLADIVSGHLELIKKFHMRDHDIFDPKMYSEFLKERRWGVLRCYREMKKHNMKLTDKLVLRNNFFFNKWDLFSIYILFTISLRAFDLLQIHRWLSRIFRRGIRIVLKQ